MTDIKKNQKWRQNGNMFFPSDTSTILEDGLQFGIYTLNHAHMIGFYLERTADEFGFNHKIYGMETGFIERIVKTYENTDRNLGLLLNGLKGTGKTVTSKLVCNALKLPVILINDQFEEKDVPGFINSIEYDVVIMIDEYEKVFGKDSDLLTLMDGVLTSNYRRVFILTTNDVYINENLLQRPSRIRYFKTYKDLSPNVIEDVVNDLLIYPEHKDALIKFVASLEIITIDVVKEIILEINLHNESPEMFKDIFNVKKMTGKFNVFEVTEDNEGKITETLIHTGVKINPKQFDQYSVHDSFYLNGEYFGEITEVHNFDMITVMPKEDNDNKKKSTKSPKAITFRFEAYDSLHKSFQFGKMSQYVL